MEKKYVLTDEVIDFYGRTLHRIEAVRDFGNVKAGDKGGFIESEDNLSHEGNAWVYNDAKVCQRAVVKENAKVKHDALVMERAVIRGNAIVGGKSEVSGNAVIYQNAAVINASVFNSARIGFHAYVKDVKISGRTRVFGIAKIQHQNEVLCFENILGDVLTFWLGMFSVIQVHSLKSSAILELSDFKKEIRRTYKGNEKRLLLKACRLAQLQIKGCRK